MLYGLVLNLLPSSRNTYARETSIAPKYLTDWHLHALFLTLMSSVDDAALTSRFVSKTMQGLFIIQETF